MSQNFNELGTNSNESGNVVEKGVQAPQGGDLWHWGLQGLHSSKHRKIMEPTRGTLRRQLEGVDHERDPRRDLFRGSRHRETECLGTKIIPSNSSGDRRCGRKKRVMPATALKNALRCGGPVRKRDRKRVNGKACGERGLRNGAEVRTALNVESQGTKPSRVREDAGFSNIHVSKNSNTPHNRKKKATKPKQKRDFKNIKRDAMGGSPDRKRGPTGCNVQRVGPMGMEISRKGKLEIGKANPLGGGREDDGQQKSKLKQGAGGFLPN